jgi:cell division protein FtsW (lipid II flippase)
MLAAAWPWLLLVVAGYCVLQIVRDFRRRAYWMAAFGLLCLVLLLLVPIPSRAVKLDLPLAR